MKLQEYLEDWFADWIGTWPRRNPWKDIPSILAILLGIGFVYIVLSWDPVSIRGRYASIMNHALASKDYPTVLVACQRMMSLDPSLRHQSLFCMVIAHQGLGHQDKAQSLLSTLAPPDRPVFAQAHMYAARTLLQQRDALPQQFGLIKAQLNQVLALEPESVEAHEILGSIYSSFGELSLACDHFSAIVKQRPNYMITLALLARKQSNEKAAENWTRDALNYFQNAVEQSESDKPSNRIAYIEALMLKNDFEKARNVLDEGRKLSGDAPYEAIVAPVCVGLARHLATTDPGKLDFRIKLIREGMAVAPKDVELLGLLLGLSEREGVESPQAGDRIIKMLGKKDVWPPLLFVGAKISRSRGDSGSVNTFLEHANALDPKAPVLAHNLAMAGGMNYIQFGLELVDFAIEKIPNEPLFRMGRGQILTRLSRVQEGLSDLQYCLERVENKAPVHQAIADAYLALGMKNLAVDQLRLSNSSSVGTAPGKAESVKNQQNEMN